MIEKIRNFYQKHEGHATSIAFILGFIWDNLTLTRIDLRLDNLILLTYLMIAGLGIIAFNTYEHDREKRNSQKNHMAWLPLVIQFAFGGLFSGFIIFYVQSASWAASWPFILLLIFIFIGNERFRTHYALLPFQSAIFFTALFLYLIFSIPVLLGTFGPGTFLLSGGIGLIGIFLLLYAIAKNAPDRLNQQRSMLIVSILSIYIALNGMYFSNIIPPIPLALKEIGVYHHISRTEAGYVLRYEEAPWYRPFKKTDTIFTQNQNDPVYVWSAIFAPTKLSVDIQHEWFYFNEVKDDWELTSRIRFPITGGRDGGYRGFSLKHNVIPGKWRVEVTTLRGQLIGRTNFVVVASNEEPLLIEEIQ